MSGGTGQNLSCLAEFLNSRHVKEMIQMKEKEDDNYYFHL